MTLSIAELAAAVQGKINNSLEKSADLIENFMVGASIFDRGPAYYNRKTNKAVILWGERPGVRKAALAGYQIAALGTSTRCIVLSANAVPAANVAEQATTKGVPIISAPGDVSGIIGGVDSFMAKLKFGQVKKMPKLLSLLEQNLNMGQLSRKIGLAA
jgi:BioD-like phosphotransacetylase family protein